MISELSSPYAPSTPVRKPSNMLNATDTPYATNTTPNLRTPSSTRSYATSLTSPFSSTKLSSKPPSALSSLTKSVMNTSPADVDTNWRARAEMNGIKVENGDTDTRKEFSASPGRLPFSNFHRCTDTPSPKNSGQEFKYSGAFTVPLMPSRRPFFQSPCTNIGKHKNTGAAAYIPSPISPLPTGLTNPFTSPKNNTPPAPILCCSVCEKEPCNASRMIILSPCAHIFCSSCFTGTLNIVGEKNMSCMKCNSSVASFRFAGVDTALDAASRRHDTGSSDDYSAMPLCDVFKKFPGPLSAKCLGSANSLPPHQDTDCAILRIDNVPWDVTPPMLEQFINRPLLTAYVLLDGKGKTLSHAFVQLLSEDARCALRSLQNAILGRGKRARAVTITLSSQEELMVALYPSWGGTFKGGAPSLDGLDNARVSDALQHGLISNAELASLLNLIITPNCPFLKVPSLPFYHLISLLCTFPSDADSQIFWTSETRDTLFLALRALIDRSESAHDRVLYDKLRNAAIACQAFTNAQRRTIIIRNKPYVL